MMVRFVDSDFQNAEIVNDSNVDAHAYAAQALFAACIQDTSRAIGIEPCPGTRPGQSQGLGIDGALQTGAKLAKLEESRKWSLKVLDVDPQNRDASYLVAFVDWMELHSPLVDALVKNVPVFASDAAPFNYL